jgi:hypothetical protein
MSLDLLWTRSDAGKAFMKKGDVRKALSRGYRINVVEGRKDDG